MGRRIVALILGLPLIVTIADLKVCTPHEVVQAFRPAVLAAQTRPSSGVELDAIDRKTDACVDFYQFACGGWIARNPLPADRRSFGRFAEFVTRIASGRVTRSLPNALHNCGYRTYSVYPWLGAFLSARGFQKTLGIDHFYDAEDLKTHDVEPDA